MKLFVTGTEGRICIEWKDAAGGTRMFHIQREENGLWDWTYLPPTATGWAYSVYSSKQYWTKYGALLAAYKRSRKNRRG